ncbi:MAG: Crp/Fnr family transcriptional regulator [Clostridiales bacterium]|jgi:CRP-like cAMP-binding protein|nr:Crp/Fnr family transcriptional regulator [Clostridiales bacterium]
MQHLVRQLNKCRLFNHLSPEKIVFLLSDIEYNVKLYSKNEVVFSPHHHSDTLGILLEGSVDVQKIFSSGKIVTVNRRFSPDLIADASIFAKIENYPSTITANENSSVFLINKSNLLKIFSKDKEIISKFLESVSNRVLALNSTIEILSLNSVAAKIAFFLLLEHSKQNSKTIMLTFTKKSLAEHLNVSRPTLSRELKNMQLRGIISLHNRTIRILSLEILEQLCST